MTVANDFMPLSLDSWTTASLYNTTKAYSNPTVDEVESWGYTVADEDDAFGLDFTDYLQLMVTQLQNQNIDNTADTSDMLNQMVQMSVVQMMSKVQSSLEDITAANTMTYAASLVGKTVTVGVYDEEGNIQEVVGEVTGTGTYQGSMVIFVGDQMYSLNSIMAVGTLPAVSDPGDSGGTEGSEGSEGTEPVPEEPKG